MVHFPDSGVKQDVVKAAGARAGVLIIGGEILSGQTQDINGAFIGKSLKKIGIPVGEIRVVPDCRQMIMGAVLDLSAAYTYVITTGGIGPTHDDITASSIGAAFGVDVHQDPAAVRILKDRYGDRLTGDDDPRLRMAIVPVGSRLLENPVSGAPGFHIGNVYALAGVPDIMQGMLTALLPQLSGGVPIYDAVVFCPLIESRLAPPLKEIQDRFPTVDIGSYPSWRSDAEQGVRVALTSTDKHSLRQAEQAVIAMKDLLLGDPTACLTER